MKTKKIEIQNLTKSCNELLILEILQNEKKHGYQLAIEIEEKSNYYFHFNHGTLYPILHKMEKEGLIKGNWQQEGSKRKRKYYSISSKGLKHLESQLAGWNEFIKNFQSFFHGE